MRAWLRRGRHLVVSAESGERALEAAAGNRFDLVISDLGLPNITGFALMTRLSTGFGLRGIAVSGYGREEDVAKSRAARFFTHLTKPVNLDRLRTLLTRFRSPDENHSPACRTES